MTQETNNLAADLWALADLLRGDFCQSQYGRVILPFSLLRRLECVLESSKPAVLVEAAKVEKMAIAEEAKERGAAAQPGVFAVVGGAPAWDGRCAWRRPFF